ncbi:MAG: hypothetical protein K8I60_01490, partial [Anaerolineae bacterium]|nr:hypothetical protein [Anaerolineae bacterium]
MQHGFLNGFSFPLGADARLHSTDYNDDQVWEFTPGMVDSPAFKLQTNYGGRTGLASIVPLWTYDGRMIYQTQAYAQQPTVQTFLPGFIRVEAGITPELQLTAEYWAMESHAIGGRFTLKNTGDAPVNIRLELFGHVGAQGKEQPLARIALANGEGALGMGKIGNLTPAVVLEGGKVDADVTSGSSPKVYRELRIATGKTVSVRWVHAGRSSVNDSITLAQQWLKTKWNT